MTTPDQGKAASAAQKLEPQFRTAWADLPVPLFGDAFTPAFCQFFSGALTIGRSWSKGFPAGGISNSITLNRRALPDQVFLQRLGWECLDSIRREGTEGLLHLRRIGMQMVSHGVYEHRLKYDDLSEGVKLHNGERAQILPHLMQRIGPGIRARYQNLREWSHSLPEQAIRLELPSRSNDGQSKPFSGHERHEAYAAAYALGKMSAGQFEVILQGGSEKACLIPDFHTAFPHQFCAHFATFQLHKAWGWRKMLEPGGSSHRGYCEVVDKKPLAPKDQVFVHLMGSGILGYLQLHGEAAVRHLSDVGEQILRNGVDLDQGEFVEPARGVTLFGGGRATIDSELLDSLAYAHHLLWLNSREYSWLLPEALRQSSAAERAEHHVRWDKGTPNAKWNPDRVNIYGVAVCLSLLRFGEPEHYEKLLTAARPVRCD